MRLLPEGSTATMSSIAGNQRSSIYAVNVSRLIRAPVRSAIQATRSSACCPTGSCDSRSLTSWQVRLAAILLRLKRAW